MINYRELLTALAHGTGNEYIEAVNQKNQLISDLYTHIGEDLDISEIAFYIGIPADNDLDKNEFGALCGIVNDYNDYFEEREV